MGKAMGRKMKKLLSLVTAIVTLALGTTAMAASFSPGDIVIYRIGGLANQANGATLTNTGNIVWLDECRPISPTDVNNGSNLVVVQSIMLPTNYFGGYSPVIEDAATSLDGLMSQSLDGRFLIFTGFGATLGQYTNDALTTFDADFQVPRVVGLIDGFGHIDTTTVQTNSFSDGEDIRSAATTDGTNLWFSGDTSGIRYTTRGSSLATQLSTFVTNIRQLNIFSNQLYFSTSSGSAIRIGTVGATPPPTTNGSYLATLPGVVMNTNSPHAFLLFNLAGQTNAFDTLYFTDDGNVGNTPGVYKWSLLAGATNWVMTGSITANGAGGLTGYSEISGGTTNVHMWITSGGTISGLASLYPYVDSTGFNVDPSQNSDGGDANQYALHMGATANGFVFRGIAMAPVGGETFPSGPGRISVGPITDVFLNNQPAGGPFTFTKNYSIANPGVSSINWAVSATNNWVGFSPSSGTLAPGASITVAVSFNANANSLAPGTNLTSIIFTNTTSGNTGFDVTTRPTTLILYQIGLSPSTDFQSFGPVGGPFTPNNKVYTLSNASSSASLTWGASSPSNWVNLSATSGTILPNHTASVTIFITNANASALSRGLAVDDILFTNSTFGGDPGNNDVNVSVLVGGGFTSNNLVIYRAGDGTVTLSNHGTPAFLDEYTRNGVLVQSIPISTNNYACSGVATAEGLMTRSTDKQYVVFVGYGTNATYTSGSVALSTTATVSRVIGRVDGNGNVDVSTRLNDFCSGSNPRAAVSTDGLNMWVGGVTGIRYAQLGDTNSTDVCTNPVSNFRALNIYSNQLYASSASGAIRVSAIGSGLPTSDTTAANLPGYSTNEQSPYNFVLFKTHAGGTDPLDTMYVADDQGNSSTSDNGAGGIFKWSLVSGSWVSNGFVSVHAVRGLAGNVSIVGTTTNVVLFAVGSQNAASSIGQGGTLSIYTDSAGWNAAPSTNAPVAIATASANERWDSIALSPEIPQAANLVLTPPSTDFDVVDQPSTVTTNSSVPYTVADVSNSSMTWTATWTSAWLSLSNNWGGTLAAGANTNITLYFNTNATTLPNGTYFDTVSLINKVNGQGNTAISVSLTITNSSAVASPFLSWQNYYFTGSPLNSSGNADPLGKGMSNTNQFLAGFNPTNSAAYLHIISVAKINANTDINVTYLGANGDSSYTGGPTSRTNVLEFTTGTANGSYTNVFATTGQTNILNAANGLGTVTNMVDSGGATNKPARYYRVRVLLP